jgi:NADH:ubiquinone reductase (H+-translocating)
VTRVVIIGGGFAGLAAAQKLRRLGRDAEVTLIDRRPTSDFLPMLPDVIGERANPAHLAYDLSAMGRRRRFAFVQDSVRGLDLTERVVHGERHSVPFDYALIASGSQTRFHGNDDAKRCAMTLDSVADARHILNEAQSGRYGTFVIAGGGYTGVEIATNLWALHRRAGRVPNIMIVEHGPRLLGALPEAFQQYAASQIQRMGIKTRLDAEVTHAEPGRVALNTGETLDNAALIWAAGVQTSEFVRQIDAEKTAQGRLAVDQHLRLNERCFVAGDAAQVIGEQGPLRMSIQFSLTEGWCAGENIVRAIRGLPLRRYRPRDLGYVVPMANNRGCGVALGVTIYGIPAAFLHYFMCIFRSRGVARRLAMIWNLKRLLR